MEEEKNIKEALLEENHDLKVELKEAKERIDKLEQDKIDMKYAFQQIEETANRYS